MPHELATEASAFVLVGTHVSVFIGWLAYNALVDGRNLRVGQALLLGALLDGLTAVFSFQDLQTFTSQGLVASPTNYKFLKE